MIESLYYNKISYLYFIISYLLGSVPVGYILFRYFKKDDIRNYGSGNIGATNVNRLLGKKLGFITLSIDMSKTILVTFLAYRFLGMDYGIYCGAFSVVGHIFPVWLKFKGGKGVACFIGLLAIVSWPLFIMFLALWLISVKIFRYSGVGAIFSIIMNLVIFKSLLILQFNYSILLFIPGNPNEFTVILAISLLILAKHQQNIKMILKKKI